MSLNRSSIFLLILTLISILSLFSLNLFFALVVLVLIIVGMDISTDFIYDSTNNMLVGQPGLLYGITLFSFITSLDEIMVAGASIAQGYNGISIGAMMGSVMVTLVGFGIFSLMKRKKEFSTVSALIFVVPSFMILFSVFFYGNVNPIFIIGLSIFTTIISIILMFYFGFKSTSGGRVDMNLVNYKSLLFLLLPAISLTILSITMARLTDFVGSFIGINLTISGFLIPGIFGSLPELFAIKSSLQNKDKSSAKGILIGSTLIKGGMILPLASAFFQYNPSDSIGIFLSTLVSLIVFGIVVLYY